MLMLWFDDNPKPLTERISTAADYYRRKYGKNPTLCLVPSAETEIPSSVDGILCRGDATVIAGHLMVGAG